MESKAHRYLPGYFRPHFEILLPEAKYYYSGVEIALNSGAQWRDVIFLINSRGQPTMAQRVRLDRIDRRILAELQENGRITNVELARRAGISAPPCLRRVRALEDAGFIHGYHGEVDAVLLGFDEMFFALVGLDSQAQDVLKAFEDAVAPWPEVRECHMIRGGGDFFLKMVARDKLHRDALTMKLTSTDHVARVQTLETIRTSKDEPGVPVASDQDPR